MSDRDTPTGPQEPTDGDTPTERIGSAGTDASGDGDTPKERFDPRASDADGETPTERFDAADAADEATRRLPQQPDRAYPEPRYPEGYSPTTRMPNPGNDAPTERFGQAATPPWQPSPSSVPVYASEQRQQRPPTEPPKPPTKSKGPMIALIIIGTLLAAAIIVLVLVLTQGDDAVVAPSASPTTSESPSPTPTETPTPTPTPTPEPASAAFVSFSPENDTEISCPDEESTVPLTFSWTSTDADRAWIAAGETDARANPDAEVDPSGTYRDLEFDCSRDSEIYTVSLENSEGELTSQSVTLRRALDE